MSGYENPVERPERVVILSPNGLYDATSLPRLSPGTRVDVVSFVGVESPATPIVVSRPNSFADRLARMLSRTAIGREVVRLTPLDPGVRFRRAAARDTRVRHALAGADLVVAPEREGALAAWHAARGARRAGRPTAAVFGYPAARAALDRTRS